MQGVIDVRKQTKYGINSSHDDNIIMTVESMKKDLKKIKQLLLSV